MGLKKVFLYVLVCLCTCGDVYADIVMTEVYPSPSTGFEWVELCNTGPESIALSAYTLQDSSGKKMTIPSLILAPQQYVLATSSGVLNNSGDTLTLSTQGAVIQDMTYDFAVSSEYSLVSCNQVWSKTLLITPGYENVPCTSPSSNPSPLLTLTPTLNVPATPTQSISPSSHTSTLTPEPNSPSPARIPAISFQKHHAPRVLAITAQPIPTLTLWPTDTPSTPPHITHQPSQLRGLGMLVWTIGALASALLTYNIVKRVNSRYNESNDIPP